MSKVMVAMERQWWKGGLRLEWCVCGYTARLYYVTPLNRPVTPSPPWDGPVPCARCGRATAASQEPIGFYRPRGFFGNFPLPDDLPDSVLDQEDVAATARIEGAWRPVDGERRKPISEPPPPMYLHGLTRTALRDTSRRIRGTDPDWLL